MAMLKIVILLFVVFKATAFENSHEIDSNHDLHHYSSSAPSSSADVEQHNKASIFCELKCGFECHFVKPWREGMCLAHCLALCNKSSDSFSEIACAIDCAQSSINNLRYGTNMIDGRINACNQQCKKE